MPRDARRDIIARERELIHVETPNGIVNIRTGLHDRLGRDVVSIEVLASNYAGERKVVKRNGPSGMRLVRLLATKN